jgi:ABC-2 type transport system permease protein
MLAIYKREMLSYFTSPIGYVFVAVFLAMNAFLFSLFTLMAGEDSSISTYFTFIMFIFIVLVPMLTMKMFSEERKMRTEQLLLTAPVTITGMVLGKYFAALTIFAIGVLLSCINFLPLYIIGAAESAGEADALTHIGPVTAEIVGSLFALILLGAALISVGTLISALTENQLSAAIITIGVIAAMVLLNVFNLLKDGDGQPIIGSYVIRFVIDWISIVSRFTVFGQGIFDFSALLYYVSLAFVFLFLTVRVYEKRRWG